jgi:hypothetical protein
MRAHRRRIEMQRGLGKWFGRALCALAPLLFAAPAFAQTDYFAWWPYTGNTSTRMGPPPSWTRAGNAPEHFKYLTDVAQGRGVGKRMATIVSDFSHPVPAGKYFGTMMQSISAQDYRGKRIQLSGMLRTNSAGGGALWMRIVNAEGKVLGFDNMDSRQLTGTRDWEKHFIVLDVPADGAEIDFGFLLDGRGEVDATELALNEVDRNVALTGAGQAAQEKTPLPSAPSNLDFSHM